MTTALCLYCGGLKWGALNNCDECNAPSTGNMDVDIAFSDHNHSERDLRALGSAIKAIHAVEGNAKEHMWAFLQYVSTHHPSILRVEPSDALQQPIARILAEAKIPPITLGSPPAEQPAARRSIAHNLEHWEWYFGVLREEGRLDMDGELTWGYTFAQPSAGKLEELAVELANLGYRVADMTRSLDGTLHILKAEKVEVRTPQTLQASTQAIDELVTKYGVECDGVEVWSDKQ